RTGAGAGAHAGAGAGAGAVLDVQGHLETSAAIAGSYCTEAYLAAAGENIQLHGGIGVTWEHSAHRYFKRATSDAELFGPPRAHRARLADHVLSGLSPG
ncbi:acyl-CoA dehydrogenase family protein, partial [Nonomuraea lactucae]|uniref:acyl-CoA dehydrogenase family protein n=1 Tax=Nonomuraea lactucae TaxID=2249762 RepID=UPI0023DD4A85